MMDMLNPIAPIRSSIRYTQTTLSTPQSYTQVGLDATLFMPPQLGVLIIGESARAQNFEYNGYNRPTNPFSKSYDLINFSNFTSCGVITAISVPCMLTNLTHKTYTARNLSHYRDNILDIAKRAGFSVYFLSNNGGDCIGAVCKRLDSDKIIYYNNKHLDGDMLEKARQIVHSESSAPIFLVLHLHGSHGAQYYMRYPQEFEFFTPICTQSNLQECSRESLLNAYDNSLRYTDFLIAQIIKEVQNLNAFVWYISDHGESLGENGMYMHGGLPYMLSPKEQTHIPSLLYVSDPSQRALAKRRQDERLNHDYVFHTLLHLLGIHTQDYEARLDILRQE